MEQELLAVGLNTEALNEWDEYRTEKGKPLSRLARKKVVNRLLKHPEDTQQRMVDRAIENDWQGLHDIPVEKTDTREITLHTQLTDRSWAH